MHDLLLAQEIYKIIKQKARENKFSKINSLTIELGRLIEHQEQITPDNLIYNLHLADQEKILTNTEFRIKQRQDNSWRLQEISGQ